MKTPDSHLCSAAASVRGDVSRDSGPVGRLGAQHGRSLSDLPHHTSPGSEEAASGTLPHESLQPATQHFAANMAFTFTPSRGSGVQESGCGDLDPRGPRWLGIGTVDKLSLPRRTHPPRGHSVEPPGKLV